VLCYDRTRRIKRAAHQRQRLDDDVDDDDVDDDVFDDDDDDDDESSLMSVAIADVSNRRACRRRTVSPPMAPLKKRTYCGQ